MTREEETETLLGNRGETPGAFTPGTVEEQSAEEALSGIIDERETTRPDRAQQAWNGGTVAFRRKAGRCPWNGWNKWRLHARRTPSRTRLGVP